MKDRRKKLNEGPWVCVCNKIPREQIEAAIKRGCRTVSRVGAATTAGLGQCGGTCRPEIERMVADIDATEGKK